MCVCVLVLHVFFQCCAVCRIFLAVQACIGDGDLRPDEVPAFLLQMSQKYQEELSHFMTTFKQ